MRETIESALVFSGEALRTLGVSEEDAQAAIDDIRSRDKERLALQQAGGMYAGLDVLHRPRVEPEPLTGPRREGRALNAEAEDAIKREKQAST
jgi:hypothetical protein